MRVLVLTPDFPPRPGGIQRLLHGVLRHAHRLDARVITLDTAGADSFDAREPLDIRRLRHLPGRHHGSRLRPAAVLALNGAGIGEALAHRPDVVLSGHIVTSPAGAAVRRMLRAPVVQYLHADELADRPRTSAFAVAHADACIAVSGYTRALALAAGCEAGRLHVIPPGVDIPSPTAAERDRRPTLITVARLHDDFKGHDVLVRAMPLIRARVPEARWVVVGDGRLRPALENLAAACGVRDALQFLGPVSDDERDAWLDRAHVFAMPSRLPRARPGGEGFGIAYLEAAAHGLPAVAGDTDAVREAVLDGVTGLLVDPTDPAAVAQAVSDLLLDPGRAARMGRAGMARAREFAWPKIAARVEEVLLAHARPQRKPA